MYLLSVLFLQLGSCKTAAQYRLIRTGTRGTHQGHLYWFLLCMGCMRSQNAGVKSSCKFFVEFFSLYFHAPNVLYSLSSCLLISLCSLHSYFYCKWCIDRCSMHGINMQITQNSHAVFTWKYIWRSSVLLCWDAFCDLLHENVFLVVLLHLRLAIDYKLRFFLGSIY